MPTADPSFEDPPKLMPPSVAGAGCVGSLLGTRPYATACICCLFDHTELLFRDLDFCRRIGSGLYRLEFSAVAVRCFDV
jgi:hypothetical protein